MNIKQRWKTAGDKAFERLFAFVLMVVSGACFANGVTVSSFGADPVDSTKILQKALDSGASCIIVDKAGSPWVTGPLFVRSNTELVFEEGVELVAKKGEFKDLYDALLTLHGVTNVTLRGLGKGAKLWMHIKDYQGPEYRHGEWRHVVNLLSVKDVTIKNLTLADSGGDGVYVGAKPSNIPCRNVVISDCICDNNNRQGISVISADGLLIERTVMKNTRGTAPRSGIDFEPNSPNQVLSRIVMRDCLTENNVGGGYEIYVGQGRHNPVDITLENCRSVGDGVGFKLGFGSVMKSSTVTGGLVRVRNSSFSNSRGSAFYIFNKPAGFIDVLFENCMVERRAGQHGNVPDVKLSTASRTARPTDGVEFRNVTIRRKNDEGWFSVSRQPWSSIGIENVKGSVKLAFEDGTSKIIQLDDEWRHSVFPKATEPYVIDDVRFDPSKVSRIVDEKPGEMVSLSPLVLRFGLDAWVYAAKPGPVNFNVRMHRVVNKQLKKDGCFTVSSARGKKIATLPVASFKAETRTFTAPTAGFYRIQCDILPQGLVFESCDAPIGFTPIPRFGLDVYRGSSDLFFAHPAGVDETFFCGGTGEAATIRLFDPNGKAYSEWRNQLDWGFVRIPPSAPEGLWRVRISRPDRGYRAEDSCYDRTGAPPVFFLSKEKCWFSEK